METIDYCAKKKSPTNCSSENLQLSNKSGILKIQSPSNFSTIWKWVLIKGHDHCALAQITSLANNFFRKYLSETTYLSSTEIYFQEFIEWEPIIYTDFLYICIFLKKSCFTFWIHLILFKKKLGGAFVAKTSFITVIKYSKFNYWIYFL